jgi:hypothetical protein
MAQPGAMPLQQVPLHRHRPWFIRRPVEGRLQEGAPSPLDWRRTNAQQRPWA